MRLRIAMSAVAGFVLAGCSADTPTTASLSATNVVASATDDGTAAITALGNAINAGLESSGAAYRLAQAEWLGGDEAGNIVIFSDRGNKRLEADFVPGDPRRGGRTNITYAIDESEGAVDGLTAAQTSAAIDRAMATWDGVSCSVLPIERVAVPPGDIGVVEFLNGLGGSPFVFADITHAGWLPGGILPPSVIGVTFTFVFIDANGPTDTDNSGTLDVAFREILYNDAFTWKINASTDVETVALHEAGHGLSQGHFGKAHATLSNVTIHFSPRAVMNAGYSGLQQTIGASDNAGHCANWASWPNK